MTFRHFVCSAAAAALCSVTAAGAQTPPPGYIYSPLVVGSLTQGCIAVGPGGTFVGVGRGFTANAQAVVLLRESGDARLVAFGFSSIGDCAYDRAADVLYVTDNADNADLDLTTGFAGNTGAQSGDTVFAIPAASTASALFAAGLELVPADSIEFASSVAVDANGDVFVSNPAGGGAGTVLKLDVDGGPALSTFLTGLDFAGGLSLDPANGHLFVAETLGTFDAQIRQVDAAGVPVPPVPFAGPSFAFGSYDALVLGGQLLVTGAFGGDVASFDTATAAQTPFVSGLTFATGIAVNDFTGRVEILSSTFVPTVEDRTVHRFVPTAPLIAGRGATASECVHEFYGLELVPAAPGGPANEAICVDGAACDADGTVNDRCVFPVGFCFAVDDQDLSTCAPAMSITELTITAKPVDAAAHRAAAAAVDALPISQSTCVFSDGVTVPVRQTAAGPRPGKARLKVKARTADGRTDVDTMKLVCRPAP